MICRRVKIETSKNCKLRAIVGFPIETWDQFITTPLEATEHENLKMKIT